MIPNINMAIGIFKDYVIRILIINNKKNIVEQMMELIRRLIIPLRPSRQYLRKTLINNSKVSYRYNY